MGELLHSLGIDEKLAPALLAATAAVISALVAAITALRTGRLTRSTARELEELKASLATRRADSEAHDAMLKARVAALDMGAATIQAFKDSIQIVLSSTRNGLTAADAIARITTARDGVIESYGSQHMTLDHPDSRLFHRAKNVTIATHQLLSGALESRAFASEIPASDRQAAMELRLQLTDAQLAIHDARTRLMSELLERRRPNAKSVEP
jgi:hypothetical protein